jgi:polysaccharide biosynthesis protein PelF
MVERVMADQVEADVCLIVEGAYPFVAGGVSSWMHDLIQAQGHLTFHLLILSADDSLKESRFVLPPNVISMSEIALQQDSDRVPIVSGNQNLSHDLEAPLTRLFERGGLSDFRQLLEVLEFHRLTVSRSSLLNSEAMFAMVERMYERSTPGSSFINYFWHWRVACFPYCLRNYLVPKSIMRSRPAMLESPWRGRF